jgi:hypothetical protein
MTTNDKPIAREFWVDPITLTCFCDYDPTGSEFYPNHIKVREILPTPQITEEEIRDAARVSEYHKEKYYEHICACEKKFAEGVQWCLERMGVK